MNFEDMKVFFKQEIMDIDNFILSSLKSKVELIDNIGNYLILHSGKRIRPLLTLIFSKIFDADYFKTISIASAIELIHTATLLHDDVVDVSDKRRGKLTVNKLWGNKEAILVGDFLYTRSFQMMVDINNIHVLKLMSCTTNTMSEGEVFQLINRGNFNITESACIEIIKCKTAKLFSAATCVSGIISNASEDLINATEKYGYYIGIAYQLIDDVLDYSSSDDRFGKKIGVDILSSTFTLPLVNFMKLNKHNKDFIINTVNSEINFESIDLIRKSVLASNSLSYVINLAKEYAKSAKDSLQIVPCSSYKDFALSLADFILNRKY